MIASIAIIVIGATLKSSAIITLGIISTVLSGIAMIGKILQKLDVL